MLGTVVRSADGAADDIADGVIARAAGDGS